MRHIKDLCHPIERVPTLERRTSREKGNRGDKPHACVHTFLSPPYIFLPSTSTSYSPFPRRWDSKCSSKCKSKSSMVKAHVSFQMSPSKSDLGWPLRVLVCIPMTISSLIFLGTGCNTFLSSNTFCFPPYILFPPHMCFFLLHPDKCSFLTKQQNDFVALSLSSPTFHIIKHTATHCNTLQHGATRYNIWRHTANVCVNTSWSRVTICTSGAI